MVNLRSGPSGIGPNISPKFQGGILCHGEFALASSRHMAAPLYVWKPFSPKHSSASVKEVIDDILIPSARGLCHAGYRQNYCSEEAIVGARDILRNTTLQASVVLMVVFHSSRTV